MKLNRLNQYFLIALIFVIVISCCSVVAFANKGEDIVDMGDLTKVTTTQSSTHEQQTVVPGSNGDVNKDGHINIRDLVMLKKYLAKVKNIIIEEKACDLNGNGRVDIGDGVLLSKYLAGFNIDLNDIATPIEPTTPAPTIATPIEPTTPAPTIATPIEPTAPTEQSTTHADPDGPGWSDWIIP